MPEGHSVHRIAKQFRTNFVGTRAEVTSPQGRFVQGAAILNRKEITQALAVGKHMFLEFDSDTWLRVHLGIYGAWDFFGEVRVDPTILVHGVQGGRSRLGQTGEYSRLDASEAVDSFGEDSVTSIGAPRLHRVRMDENDTADTQPYTFPPEPQGQVRVRLINERVCADLRGPSACEVLTPGEVLAVISRLGPDPAHSCTPADAHRFIDLAQRKKSSIGLVLMDQSVIAGIGNIYRAEILFRAGLDPHTPAQALDTTVFEALWEDWAYLLDVGIRVGQMMTMDGLEGDAYVRALTDRDQRHWVYKREGQPCRRCGTNIVVELMGHRKLYWCPECQT